MTTPDFGTFFLPGPTEVRRPILEAMLAPMLPHRGAAFDACEFVMDWLKTRAPFWKKERLPDGERWVEARASDDEAAQRW